MLGPDKKLIIYRRLLCDLDNGKETTCMWNITQDEWNKQAQAKPGTYATFKDMLDPTDC